MSSCMWAMLDIVGEEEIEQDLKTGRTPDSACEAVISGSSNINQPKGTSDELSKVEV